MSDVLPGKFLLALNLPKKFNILTRNKIRSITREKMHSVLANLFYKSPLFTFKHIKSS